MSQEERPFYIYNEIPEASPTPPARAKCSLEPAPTVDLLEQQAAHFASDRVSGEDWSVAQAFLRHHQRYMRAQRSRDVCCTMRQAFNFATLCRMVATEKCEGDECRPQCEHQLLCAAERIGRDKISLAAGPLALLVPPKQHWKNVLAYTDGHPHNGDIRPSFESSSTFITSLLAFMLLCGRNDWAQPAAGFAKDWVEPGDKLELANDAVKVVDDSLPALAQLILMCCGGKDMKGNLGKGLYKGLFNNVGMEGLFVVGTQLGGGEARLDWSKGGTKPEPAQIDARLLVGCLVVGSIVGGEKVLEGAETMLGKDFVRAAMGTMLMVWHRADEVEGWTPARILALKGVDELPEVPEDDNFGEMGG